MNSHPSANSKFPAPNVSPGRAFLVSLAVVLGSVLLTVAVTRCDGNPPPAPAPTSSSPNSAPKPAAAGPTTSSPTPVATAPTTSRVWTPTAITAWGNRVNGAMEDLSASLSRMTNAMQAGDLSAIQEACESIGQSGKKLSAALPGYNQQVTHAVQTMVNDITAAHRACEGFEPAMSEAQLSQFMADLNRAIAQGSAVTQQGG